MFYRLKSEYMLRGWKLLPTGVVNRADRKVKFLPSKKFNVLKLCNGKSASDSFDEAQRKIIDEFIADGYVEVTDKISPLEAVAGGKSEVSSTPPEEDGMDYRNDF